MNRVRFAVIAFSLLLLAGAGPGPAAASRTASKQRHAVSRCKATKRPRHARRVRCRPAHRTPTRVAPSSTSAVTAKSSVDRTPPSAPSNLAAWPGEGQIMLSWGASSDNVRVAGYRVYRGGSRLAQTAASATSYTDTGLTDGTSYSYYVVAYDAAGNVSAPSATVSAAPSSTPLPVGVRGSWSLKFDDEFTGSSLDLSRWQPNWLAADNTSTTKPANSDQNNCESPAQASVGGGSLNLTLVAASCRANNGQTYPYASALVNTHNSFTYTRGYIEARVFLPSTNGICDNWPSFWADGVETSGVSWPTFGELDVMECLSDGLNYHFHSDAGGPGNVVKMADQGGWHILGADLEPGTQSCSGSAPDPVVATYYYDGAQVGTESACIASTGMYIILSNDISSAHGGPALVPATMQVDYVRAWQ